MTPQELEVYNKGRQDAHTAAQNEVAQAKYTAEMTRQNYIFLGRHAHDYFDCDANAHKMRSLLASKGYSWTYENMEAVFAEFRDQFAAKAAEPTPVVAPVEPTAEEKVAANAAAAKATELAANLGIDLHMIANWTREEHAAAMRNPQKARVVNRLIQSYAAENPNESPSSFLRKYKDAAPTDRRDFYDEQLRDINKTLQREPR